MTTVMVTAVRTLLTSLPGFRWTPFRFCVHAAHGHHSAPPTPRRPPARARATFRGGLGNNRCGRSRLRASDWRGPVSLHRGLPPAAPEPSRSFSSVSPLIPPVQHPTPLCPETSTWAPTLGPHGRSHCSGWAPTQATLHLYRLEHLPLHQSPGLSSPTREQAMSLPVLPAPLQPISRRHRPVLTERRQS